LVVGLLMFVMYFTWIPNLNRTAGAPEYIANTRIGAGAGIIPVGGGRLVYLNKYKKALELFDGATLRVVGAAAMGGYPRQAVFDREKKLIYVVVFGISSQQLKIVSVSPFRKIRSVSLPAYCYQAVSVNIDYKHNRILVGCDNDGNIFFVDRRNPVTPKAPIWPGPSGKGIVRIEINERADRALAIGCLWGPFFNVIDLATGRISSTKFTGWLVWESAYDSATGRLFVTVPFRSIVPVVYEKTLGVERVIRSSFGARAIAVDTKNRRLFVGSQFASVIEIYDLDTFKLKKRFYLPFPRYFYYDETEHALYVAASGGLYKLKI
jgi:DNA-binding beta-propeller fold protein YncE